MSTEAPQFEWIRKGGLLAAVVVALAVWLIFFRPQKNPDSLNVPLGVEQAAIVTYSGPPVAVTPYKWGVAVNVRIAKVIQQPGTRIYDVRYIVNRAGTFDLKDYLTGEDGNRLHGLPSFKFHGDPKLSKNLDTRIQETEEVTVDVGGYYYATLAALAVFWIIWLLLIIFYRRPKAPPAAAIAPPEPTLAEMLRAFLAQLEAGTLDATAKAKMEMLLLRRWREELALAGVPMTAAIEAIGRSEKTGNPLRQLQDWLHRPASKVGREEIAAVVQPYTIGVPEPEAASSQS
jgi:hypothetical protein